MIKILKNFTKKDIILIILCTILISFQVFLDLKLPDFMSEITILVKTEGSKMTKILEQGGYMMLCAGLSLLSAILVGYLSSFVSATFSMNLRNKLFLKVESFGMEEIKKFSTSSLITRTTNDITNIQMFISMGLQMLIKAPITAVWAIMKILNKSWEWSALTGACVVILLGIIILLMITVIPKFKLIQKLIDKINGLMRESLHGIRIIRAFNAENYQEEKFNEANNNLTDTQVFTGRVMSVMSPVMYLLMNLLTLGIYFIGTNLISNAVLSLKLDLFSDMVVFSSYAMQVIMSFLMLAVIFIMYPRTSVSIERINEVLETESNIIEGDFNGETEEKGTVEFKNVYFQYPDGDEEVLEDISFTAKKGETVAFVGSTGSGKSTLINLIPRFYDTTKGTILIDGVDIKKYKLESLHDKLGYVAQKAYILNGSVNYNVSYGKREKEITDKKIKEAVEIAQAKEFVEHLPKTYDYKLSQGGTNISGGQKQRISIARAIARDPEIYIFDDSFSALDYKTDSLLRKSLKKYTKDATILIVAQRIGTIMNADKIIVLDEGKCVGMGTHKELLKTCKIYKEIAESQITKEELENA